MNIDIGKDVAVGFDVDGRPINYSGNVIPWREGKGLCVSGELMESLRKAQEEIEEIDEYGGD